MASGFLEVEEEEGLEGGVRGLRSLLLGPSFTWVCLQATGEKREVEVEVEACWEVEALGFFLSDRMGELEADRGLFDPSESDFFEEKKSLFLNTISFIHCFLQAQRKNERHH